MSVKSLSFLGAMNFVQSFVAFAKKFHMPALGSIRVQGR